MLKVENINHNSCKEPVMKLVASQDGKMDEVEGGTLGTPFKLNQLQFSLVFFMVIGFKKLKLVAGMVVCDECSWKYNVKYCWSTYVCSML